jgi:hypothetical protein
LSLRGGNFLNSLSLLAPVPILLVWPPTFSGPRYSPRKFPVPPIPPREAFFVNTTTPFLFILPVSCRGILLLCRS